MTRTRHADVLVIGGGIIGLTCAYFLHRAGRKVCLIEKEKVGGDGASSYGNCGLLFYSDLPPLCQPGAVVDALVRMIRPASPLYIKPQPDITKLVWLLRFAAKSTRSHFRHALQARHALFARSSELYDQMFTREKMECNWEKKGVLLVFQQSQALERYDRINTVLRPFGMDAIRLSRTDLLDKEPALSRDVCGGWYHPLDAHLRPELLLHELRTLLMDRGVTILEDCPLTRLNASAGAVTEAVTPKGRWRADHYVLAAGAWSAAIASWLGLRLPVQPGKGYSLTISRPKPAPRIPCYFWERSVVATSWDDGLRLGGTMEFSGYNRQLNRARLENLTSAAQSYLQDPPKQSLAEEWTGLRPMSYDDLPIIGPAPGLPNLFIATGHGMIGLTAATGTAEMVTHMITGDNPVVNPAPFGLRRF